MARHTIIITASFVLAAALTLQGQDFRWPRKKALEIGGGTSADGLVAYAGYVYFFPPRRQKYKRFNTLVTQNQYIPFPCKQKTPIRIPPGLSAKVSVFYEQGSGKSIRYRIIGIDGAFLYAIYHNEKLYVNIKGGVTVSNDALITPLEEGNSSDRFNRVKAGVVGGGEIEWMVGIPKKLSIITGFDQRYLFNESDSWGRQRWYAFAGLRFKVRGG